MSNPFFEDVLFFVKMGVLFGIFLAVFVVSVVGLARHHYDADQPAPFLEKVN